MRKTLTFTCPGCEQLHEEFVEDWAVVLRDGELTVAPDMIFSDPPCVSLLRNGQLKFHSTSQHKLAGQTVPFDTFTLR